MRLTPLRLAPTERDRGSIAESLPFGEVYMMDLSRMRRALWLASVAFTITACDGTAPRVLQPVSLSVTTKGTSGVAVPAGSGVSAAIQIGSGANSLSITQAQIVLARIELSTAGTCATTGEQDDCAELRLGPTLVDLPVDATTQVMLEDAAVPAGTYSGVRAKLDAANAEAIARNIGRSARAFEDDNHDGVDDDEQGQHE